MEETMTTEVGTEITQTTEEARTFTQEELNKIVQERVFKERAKYENYEEMKAKAAKFDEMEEASKTELQKAQERAEKLEAKLKGIEAEQEVRAIKEKVSTETGVPINLLTGTTEEDCKTQADAILGFAKVAGYPTIRDGGEPQRLSKNSARDDFKNWANQVNS